MLFLTAAVRLAIASGPGMLYVLARSLAGGKREGVLSALGTFLGGMVHVFAAALGVSVILARSALAFSIVKYAGAAYLCVLGVRMILEARKSDAVSSESILGATGATGRNPLRQGVTTEALNPKTALFFLSFTAVRQSRRRARILSIRCAGNGFCDSEYFRRPDCDFIGGPAGKKDSFVNRIPAQTANADGRDHDWARDVSGDEREQIVAG
jgi:LysE type translocator